MLVDTSVWSLLLHRKNSANHPAISILKQSLANEESVCISGIIFQEILQGIRSETQRQKVKKYLGDFDLLEATMPIHEEASQIFVICRSKGISAHSIDCLIAALAIHYHQVLLTADRDFILIARHTALQLAGL